MQLLSQISRQKPNGGTLTEFAAASHLSKPTVRRLLLTLRDLGYVEVVQRKYRLTPKILEIGFSFLDGLDFPSIAQPFLERLSERVGESTNMAILDGTEIVYVARVAVKRILSWNIHLGSRLPAQCTSLGKILLASLSDEEIGKRYASVRLEPFTPSTITRVDTLLNHLREVRSNGFALNNEELEVGLRSAAAPIFDATGTVVAAINVSSSASRISMQVLKTQLLPPLITTAQEISRALGHVDTRRHE